MSYTYEKALNYAKKHKIQFRLYTWLSQYDDSLKYGIDVSDAYDGFLRSESYNVYYDSYYGYRYERMHYGYAFKKDDELAYRICRALTDNEPDCIVDGRWYGYDID